MIEPTHNVSRDETTPPSSGNDAPAPERPDPAAGSGVPAGPSDIHNGVLPLRLPSQRATRRPRTVLVLGGGGMRGMAHVGVLKAMRDLGIRYDAIVGTSIGSLVGAMAAGGIEIEEIEMLDRALALAGAKERRGVELPAVAAGKRVAAFA